MYYVLFLRLLIVLCAFLQGCRPEAKLKDRFLLQVSATKDTPKPAVVLGLSAQDALSRQSALTIELSSHVFTASSTEKVSFFQETGVWKAKIQDSWLGASAVKILPIFFDQKIDMVTMLQRLAKQPLSIHQHSIHILPIPQGKCVFLGKVGLQGGTRAKENVELLKQLLARGIDPNSPIEEGSTLLHYAAKQGYIDIVEELLSREADPNSMDEAGCTPLHYAATQGHVVVVDVLLNIRDIEPNSIDEAGCTPLHYAAAQGNLAIVESLLNHGANAHSIDIAGKAPLHYAAQYGYLEVVKRLIAPSGAELAVANGIGNTILHIAALSGHIDLVRLLLLEEGMDPDIANEYGYTPLYYAVEHGHLEIMQLLRSGGADNRVNQFGPTALHIAASRGHIDLVEKLLQEGIDPNLTTQNYRMVPLHGAAARGQLGVIALLLTRGAGIDVTDLVGCTALYHATQHNKLEAVKFLLSKNANPNITTQYDDTPLHLAVSKGNIEAIKLLLQAGADVNKKNNNGATPLHLAIKEEAYAMEVTNLLLQGGTDINIQDNNGDTALHIAADNGILKEVAAIIQKNKRASIYTILLQEYMNNHVELCPLMDMVDIMTDYVHGIDWSLKNNQGKTIQDLQKAYEA